MVAQWAGRGADGGRDLVFVETQTGPINTRPVRWLVSCKDHSDSERAVTERDAGNVSDKVRQHKCDGFLLATTTTASTGLKELLDQLDIGTGGSIQTKVWDRFEITRMLLSNHCADVLLQFFPEHHRQEAVAKLDGAREVVEASLPRFVAGYVRQHLVPATERRALLAGSKVWPHDAKQLALIVELKTLVFRRAQMGLAIEKLPNLQLDAFMSFCDTLIRNFPKQAGVFLRVVAQRSTDGMILYNTIEMLRETDDFWPPEELEITRKYTGDVLFQLYQQEAMEYLHGTGRWTDWLPSEAHRLGENFEIVDIYVDDLDFSGGEAVCFTASVSMKLRDASFSPEVEPAEEHIFISIKAHFHHGGLEIDSIKIDAVK
jgi:hypothetical protein